MSLATFSLPAKRIINIANKDIIMKYTFKAIAAAAFIFFINCYLPGHIISQAALIGKYSRKK